MGKQAKSEGEERIENFMARRAAEVDPSGDAEGLGYANTYDD